MQSQKKINNYSIAPGYFLGISILYCSILIILKDKTSLLDNLYQVITTVFSMLIVVTILVALFFNFKTLSDKLNLTTVSEELKQFSITLIREAANFSLSRKLLLLGILSSILALVLILFDHIKLGLLALCFCILYFLNELPSIKSVNKDLAEKAELANEHYKKNYKFIFYSSRIIKMVFLLYLFYFFFWCFIGKLLVLTITEHDFKVFQVLLREINNSGKTLYLLYCLFLNTIVLDFYMESYIIYYHLAEQFLGLRLLFDLGKRIVRAATTAVGGTVLVGAGVVYSPLVEMPGVNEFQIRYGRGYGYRTMLDYGSGIVYQRYLTREQMEELVTKYGATDRVLDGIFFRLLHENKDVTQIIRKNATVNELRFLGHRSY